MKVILLGAMFVVSMLTAAQLPQLRIEPTTGGSIFYVKNVESHPLTAYLIELLDYPGSYYALWQDDILDPIAPGKENKMRVGNMTVGAVPDYVKVQAAIYADGSTAGNPERVAQFVERRKFTLQTVRETIARIQKAGSKDATLADLKAQHTPAPKGGRYSKEVINHGAAQQVFSDTAAYLGSHSLEETVAWLRGWAKALESSR